MLRKLIMFAITSGLAKKAWDHYRSRPATGRPVSNAAMPPATRQAVPDAVPPSGHARATTVGVGPV